ncbi:MAG: RNA methyltransferase [Caldilineaceae bacterium]
MQEITSSTNPRLKLARKLQRRRSREQAGLCLLEGLRLVADAFGAGVDFDAVFVTPRLVDQSDVASLLADMEKRGIPLFSVNESLLADLSDTVTPQGIVAISHTPTLAVPANASLLLVLDGVGDPGNAGTLLRSGAASGVDLVLFGPRSVDPFSPKVLRAGMGAHFRVPVRVCATWEVVADYIGPGWRRYVADAGGKTPYDGVDWRLPSALIVGSEAHGPSDAANTDALAIGIPMQAATESLNAAVAGSVILFEAARQRRTRL